MADIVSNQEEKELNIVLEAPADFTSPEELYQDLIATIRRYHPSDDTAMVEKSYKVALDAHKDQKRKSGEPYIIHPICVSIILADLEMDKETIVAGLLHDVVEDTILTEEELSREFGSEVALLVDGVTKLDQLSWSMDKVEIQAENLRKMFLAMAKDIRVIIIKLADRLHNMRTLKYMKPEKQREIATETMEIYAPIANRLGISKIKVELDDLALKYLHPEVYYDLVEKVSLRKGERDSFVQTIVEDVKSKLKEAGIEGARVEGRAKHFFSIYKKMVNQNKTLDQIYDLFAVRILVDTVKDCYAALGMIHEMYKPIPGRFKDYIAMPKPNMYQSLHTTLIGKNGQPFEIQIRTFDMHRTAEFGIAAHWRYKEIGSGLVEADSAEAKLSWLREILEWQRDMDNKEFISLLKSDLDLFSESVYCFTPSGDVKNLPRGSTTIDFAYSIHSAVGNKMVGARVNKKLVPIEYEIQNGDSVEIITSQNSKGPSRDWLNMVKSTQAKNKINQWFKTERKEDNILRGKEMVDKYCKTKSINQSEITKPEFVQKVLEKYGFKDWDSVMAAIGHGGLKEGQVINKLQEEYAKKHRKEITDAEAMVEMTNSQTKAAPVPIKSKSGITVKGIHDLAVHFSRCCSPVPGDEIIGFITRGRGISIHRTDCINIINLPEIERDRLIDAEWQKPDEGEGKGKYSTEINIFANNRIGMFVDISKVFTERQIDIKSMNVRTSKQGKATITMTFDISGKEELSRLTDKLRQISGVIDIERAAG